MQNVLKKINKTKEKIEEIEFLLSYIDNLSQKFVLYIPNYPEIFVKRIIKAAGVTEVDIQKQFFVSMDRARSYRYCQNISPQTKYDLVKYSIKRLFDDKTNN